MKYYKSLTLSIYFFKSSKNILSVCQLKSKNVERPSAAAEGLNYGYFQLFI
jgi:hypothetical protein